MKTRNVGRWISRQRACHEAPGLEFNPHHPLKKKKKSGMEASTCHSSAGKVETRRLLGLASQPVLLNEQDSSSMQNPISKKWVLEEYTLWQPLASTHMHAHLYNTHIHKKRGKHKNNKKKQGASGECL